MTKGAVLSVCDRYRYRLWRRWAPGPLLVFIMLNPSIADASIDDPTITRCMERARRLGYAGIMVVNLFAWRSTDPKVLRNAVRDPIGPKNDASILYAARAEGGFVVCAWGTHGALHGRAAHVLRMLDAADIRYAYLGELTKDGHPRHPLYVRYEAGLTPWRRS